MICFALFLISVYLLLIVYISRQCLFNPVTLFFGVNYLISVGVLVQLNMEFYEADYLHYLIILVSSTLLFSSSVFSMMALNLPVRGAKFRQASNFPFDKRSGRKLIFLFVLSSLLTSLYYYLVGYNLLLSSLLSVVDDATSARIAMYAGDTYYAPGIFNQFKNILLPISFIGILYYFKENKKSSARNTFLLIATPFLTWALLGTGQRAFFFGFFVIFLIFLYFYRGKIRFNFSQVVVVGIAIFLFSFVSVLLGRESNLSLTSSFEQLGHRIFISNQWAAVEAMRYIDTQNIVWGSEWLRSIVGLIPGVEGSDLSNRIHEYMFGSIRGTAPPSVWGSAYHNWGFAGVAILAVLIPLLFGGIFARFVSGVKTPSRIIGYSALTYILATWVAGTPSVLFNMGLPAIILYFLVNKLRF